LTVALEVDRLARAGYLGNAVDKMMTCGDARPWHFMPMLAERGAREVGQWPTADAFAALLEVLDSRIEEETQPAERTKLQKFRDAATDVGKGVFVGILLDIAKRGGL
jgi:hypothetical protein